MPAAPPGEGDFGQNGNRSCPNRTGNCDIILDGRGWPLSQSGRGEPENWALVPLLGGEGEPPRCG